jgi:leader peptidase (prepilin peptidase)/N-methyltransferase
MLAVADERERRIPNRVVLPAAAVCAALSLADGVHTSASLLGGAVLVLLMLAVSLAWPVALGMGDVKLALLILCALDGATATALILTLELYAVIALLLLIRHGRAALGTTLPLAPIIAVGSLLALLV